MDISGYESGRSDMDNITEQYISSDQSKWVADAMHGDSDALVRLIMDDRDAYYRLAWVYVKNNEDALDALSDMIVILHEKIGTLRKPSAFSSWSRSILINCCREILRKRKRTVPVDFGEQYAEGDAAKAAKSALEAAAPQTSGEVQNDDRMLIEQHMSKLDAGHQEVIRLRFYLDMEYQKIAEIMKIPLGTVKSRISAGLRKLRNSMEVENKHEHRY